MTGGGPQDPPGARAVDPRLAGALAAMAVHDLRNLLAVAESSAYLALGSLDDRPFAERHLTRVRATIRKAQELVARCLQVSRGEPVQKSSVPIARLWEDLARDLVVPPGVTVRMVEGAAEQIASCEPLLLGRALANLVENALDALAERSQGQVWLEAARRGAGIALRVCDDGPGITRELAFAGVTTKAQGSGLGMLAARAVVVAHGGTLELVDTDAGTTFEIVLPA